MMNTGFVPSVEWRRQEGGEARPCSPRISPSDSEAPSGGSWQTERLIANHLLNTLGVDDEPWDGKGVNVAIIDSGGDAFYEVPLHGTYSFLNGAYPKDNQ